jgi:dihydroneopterin aldolase
MFEHRRLGSMFERFTERARKAVVLAQEEAGLLRHNYIGTEHILLGLVREGEGVAARVLSDLGVSPDDVRRELVRILPGEPGRRLEDERREAGPPEPAQNRLLFRGRVESLRITARLDGQPETLLVDLDYAYVVRDTEDASSAVNHHDLLTGVTGVLEAQELRSIEMGVWRVGEHVLEDFPAVREITVTATDQRMLEAHTVSGFTVSRTFRP